MTEIYDYDAAQAYGLRHDQITVLIHCGSRGLGHQVCTDYVRDFQGVMQRHNIVLPDRELVAAPLDTAEGRAYLAAMQAAANFAFANRQVLAMLVRESFDGVLANTGLPSGLRQVYDVAHNIAKIERHRIGGRELEVCVHRKGATRAFAPHHSELPPDYQEVGQPVLVPGSMGLRGISSLLHRDTLTGVETTFATFVVAIAIVAGLLVASAVVSPRRSL